MRTYFFETQVGKERISELSKLPKKHRNKGVLPWKIGQKKFRVVIALTKSRIKTIGYFHTFQEAVDAYLEAHLARFGGLPANEYVDPSTGLCIYNGAV